MCPHNPPPPSSLFLRTLPSIFSINFIAPPLYREQNVNFHSCDDTRGGINRGRGISGDRWKLSSSLAKEGRTKSLRLCVELSPPRDDSRNDPLFTILDAARSNRRLMINQWRGKKRRIGGTRFSRTRRPKRRGSPLRLNRYHRRPSQLTRSYAKIKIRSIGLSDWKRGRGRAIKGEGRR